MCGDGRSRALGLLRSSGGQLPMTRDTRGGGTATRRVLALLGLILLTSSGRAPAQQAMPSGTQAGTPRYKLLRSVSGTKGATENGRFVIEDPRTVFYLPDDKQLVFYFEWEGPPAAHRLEGVWTDPTGKVASASAFDYDAKERRFGAQWSLPVAPGMALGTWAFDVRVDGEAAGRHPFQSSRARGPRTWSPPNAPCRSVRRLAGCNPPPCQSKRSTHPEWWREAGSDSSSHPTRCSPRSRLWTAPRAFGSSSRTVTRSRVRGGVGVQPLAELGGAGGRRLRASPAPRGGTRVAGRRPRLFACPFRRRRPDDRGRQHHGHRAPRRCR